jgi:hypothetical protein
VLGAAPSAVAGPLSLAGGRLRFSGQILGNYGSDDEGYFNYGDYGTSRLRLFRVDLAAEARLSERIGLLAEIRSDNLDTPDLYALYLRLRPWAERRLDLQLGLVPPVFGALPRRSYAGDEPLPSLPLVYQYLTDLRYDEVPANAEALVSQRGRGWLVGYPGGVSAEPGLPVVAGERWDAGAQVAIANDVLGLTVAVTQGSLSRPLVSDDNEGKQVSARLQWTPTPAWTFGLSGATGEFLADEATRDLPPSTGALRNRQQALGADAAWSAGHWIVRAEAVFARFSVPDVAETRLDDPLPALGGYLEARLKLRPGLFAAARLERLAFSEVDTTLGSLTWDAPVTRIEAGVGFVPLRPLLLRGSWQHNRRDGGRIRSNHLFCGSVMLWF